MFNANDVKVTGTGSKYQTAGVSEKVKITEVVHIHNETFDAHYLQLKTTNENEQAGLSKRLSLNTTVNPGKSVAAWVVSAKYLLGILMSIGLSETDAKKVLAADSREGLIKNLENSLIGKEFRGLFTSREYQPGKYAIELYNTEPVGGTRLVYDPNNSTHNSKLTAGPGDGMSTPKSKDDLPF